MNGKLAVLGAGRVGTALAELLSEHFDAVVVVVRSRSGPLDTWATQRGIRIVSTGEISSEAPPSLVLVCVPDGALVSSVASIGGAWQASEATSWIHTSGAQPGSVLARHVRGSCGSIHPLYPFGPAFGAAPSLRGCAFAVDGTPRAHAVALELVTYLGGIAIEVDAAARVAWHLAAVIASNGVYALLASAESVLRAANIDAGAASGSLALLAEASARSSAVHGYVRAATGPVVRGDANTVERHRDWIHNNDPQLDVLYREIGERLVALASERGLQDADVARVLGALYAQRH